MASREWGFEDVVDLVEPSENPPARKQWFMNEDELRRRPKPILMNN